MGNVSSIYWNFAGPHELFVVQDYSEDEIYNQILPFKQKQLEQLKEVEDTLKVSDCI